MNIKRLIGMAFSSPSLFIKKIYWHLVPFFHAVPSQPIIKNINGIDFNFDFNFSPVIHHMYLGIYEPETLAVLENFVSESGTFIDVGANIGFISANAASLVGKTGKVHSFEPVPKFYNKLQELVNMNQDYNIKINNCAVGDVETVTEINISGGDNIGWNTIVPNFMEDALESIETKVIRLDNYLEKNSIEDISMIKIDVEGFEFPVLKSLSGYLEKHKDSRPPILVEICPKANALQGFSLTEIEEFMGKYSYKPFRLDGKKQINLSEIKETENVLFLLELSDNL